MKLQFDDLDLEPEPSCNYDYVLIFDNVSGRFMGKFCGSSCAGSTIVLESREARVVLRSDGSSNGAGFSLQAWRAAPCKWQWHRADKKSLGLYYSLQGDTAVKHSATQSNIVGFDIMITSMGNPVVGKRRSRGCLTSSVYIPVHFYMWTLLPEAGISGREK